MRKIVVIGILLVSLVINQGACPFEPSELAFDIGWEEQGFSQIDTTGYIITGTTSSGVHTHYGVAACNPHLGEVAILYTVDGHYLGTFIVADTGSNSKLVNGTSIDVWMPSYDVAKAWMTVTQGRVMCKFVQGVG